MLNLVYVKLPRDHYKEDTTWCANNAQEALSLVKFLTYLGHDAQRIDQEVFDAMPDRIEV